MRQLITVTTLWALLTLSAAAQEISASITGRVTDASNSAIVGATVQAKDLDRGTEWTSTTNEEGIYAFPRVPAGNYSVRVEARGFKAFVQEQLRLDVNTRARLDASMQVGALTESVSVTADTALLQTDTTQLGTSVNPLTIDHAALISRNPVALTLFAPGVVTPNPGTFNDGRRSTGNGRPYVNGNREEGNNFLLDGVDNNLTSENETAYQPNPDAIQEFRMITNNASAEFGNFQGGVINVVIKSGTNQFHGTLFEDLRNDKLNANSWANNWKTNPTIPRTILRWNQFGGTLGGPIFKDKLFFFADYQGLRKDNPPVTTNFTVLPTAFRQGDFSALLDPSIGIQLYNPFSADAAGNRAPFANNQIPVSLFSPAVRNLITNTNYYPAPLNSALRFNQTNSAGSYVNSDQGDFKLDWKITPKDDFSGRYSNGRQDNPATNSFPLVYNTFFIAPFQNGVVNWTRTITPTLVNEARFGVNDIMNQNGGSDKGLGDIAQKIGIANAGAGLLSLRTFTYLNDIGSANVGTQQLFANSTFHYADNLTIIRGRHLIKTGAQLMRRRLDAFYSGNNGRTGYQAFNGQYTRGPNGKSPTSKAFNEADFVLGLPNDIGRGLSNGNTWGQRQSVWGIYVQDDWRATDSLTLNLGVRWDYSTPWVEVNDRQVNFGLFSGVEQDAGKDGNSRGLYNPYKKDFQPRIGFAWTPAGTGKKLVLRGAYTISSFMEGTGTNLRLTMNPPVNSEFQATYQSALSNLPGSTVDQGFVGSRGAFVGANIRLWDPEVRPAEVQQWNFTAEYQLPANNVFSLGYVGQHGTHLIAAMPFFQRQLLTPGQPSIASPYMAGNPTITSQITQISGTQSGANQAYNGLQASLRKRFSAGIEYQISYTWSHAMSDSIGYYGDSGQSGSQSAYMQNLYDRRAEWGPQLADAQHNFVASYFYELPVGKGKKFGGSMAKPVDYAIGGWQLGGSFVAHTGFPLTIKTTDHSGTLARSARANVVGVAHNSHIIGPGNHWLDGSAYADTANLTFGNAGVGTERGPGAKILSLSLSKKFPVGERRWFEIRGEAFNLANTPIFNSPVSQTITSATFGEISTATGERNIQLVAKFYF